MMNFYVSLIGFQLYIRGFNTELGNLALNKPALSSSVYFERSDTINSVDGNRESNWNLDSCFVSNDGDLTPWLMVDLQGFFKISSVLLVNRGDCCAERLNDFTVETLLQNPSDSSTAVASRCLHYYGSPGLGETVTLDCEQVVTGRYVRVRNSGEVMQVCEIEVYGEPAVPHCSAFHGTVNARMQSNQSLSVENPVQCADVCADAFSCLAFNFRWSDLECEIVTGTAASDQADGWILFERNIC